MLIEFSVSNFRSFREKQTFSMVASPRLKKKNNTFSVDVEGESLPNLLKVAAIYGPNASGKSSLIKALGIFQAFTSLKPRATLGQLPVNPFRFDAELRNAPSRFEVHFVEQGQRYQFELAATQERITEERLISFPKGKATLLYERRHIADRDVYIFSDALEGSSSLHEAWRQLTGPQVLFISQAVANSNEDLQQLRIPFQWLEVGVFSLNQGNMSLPKWFHAARVAAARTPKVTAEMSAFLRDLDVPVTTIRIDEDNSIKNPFAKDFNLTEQTEEDVEKWMNSSAVETTLTHKTALGEADFDLLEESDGTRALLGIWMPWALTFRKQSSIFRALAIDEFDSSLHPEIVANLIKRHLTGNFRAQLIFTTHDTHLMDTKLLRRDQFWLTERDSNGATQLRSIHDFDGREGEDVEKRYYEGRYRSLPVIQEG